MKTKRFLGFIILAALVLVVSACGQTKSDAPASDTAASYKKISPEEAKERMDKNPDAIILDVRTQAEYEEKHIEGAIVIPNETITTDKKPELLPNLDAEILVYCRSGNRSQQAAEKLIALGYTNVYDFGGIGSWPYETVSGK